MAIQVLCKAFFWKIYTHPPTRNANNIEPYTFVMLFSGKSDNRLPPTVLHNTWMAPNAYALRKKPQNGRFDKRYWDTFLPESVVQKYKKLSRGQVYIQRCMQLHNMSSEFHNMWFGVCWQPMWPAMCPHWVLLWHFPIIIAKPTNNRALVINAILFCRLQFGRIKWAAILQTNLTQVSGKWSRTEWRFHGNYE